MPVKIWLPWKRQIAWAKTCHTKLLPDNFEEKSPSLEAFASISKKVINAQIQRGHFLPPPPPPPPQAK